MLEQNDASFSVLFCVFSGMGAEGTLAKPGGGLPTDDIPGGGTKGETGTTGENPGGGFVRTLLLTSAGKSSSGKGYFGAELAVRCKPGGSLAPPFSGGLRSVSPFTTVFDLSLRMDVAGGVGVCSLSLAFSLRGDPVDRSSAR